MDGANGLMQCHTLSCRKLVPCVEAACLRQTSLGYERWCRDSPGDDNVLHNLPALLLDEVADELLLSSVRGDDRHVLWPALARVKQPAAELRDDLGLLWAASYNATRSLVASASTFLQPTESWPLA